MAVFAVVLVSWSINVLSDLMPLFVAYKSSTEKSAHWSMASSFPWEVCMRDLCTMKAESMGPFKTITQEFYELMTMASSIRTLS